jgi:hypothetical protein
LRTTAKKEAEAIAKEKVRRILDRAHGVRVIRSVKLGALFEKYLAYCQQNNRPSIFKKKRYLVRHILDFFGDIPLASVTRERVDAFKAARRRKLGPAAVNHEFAALKHGLHLAVELDYLETSLADRVKKFKEPPGRLRYLTREEAFTKARIQFAHRRVGHAEMFVEDH